MADMFMVPRTTPAPLGLNINDIIDVIAEDKGYADSTMSCYGREGTPSEANCSAVSSSLSRNDPDIDQKRKAQVQIIEQPQPKALRFRYICEGRSAGSVPGIRSTAENKTYPAIKILNYKGPAVVVVSCVTVDPPYRPHPHNLVGKEGCSKGVCTVTIDNDSMECMFSNLGIQCVKKKDVDQALKLREEIRVDPFGTGFNHRNQPQSIDLNAVRLCFQVFLSNGKNGRFTYPLKPVVSDPIYDKKATSDLNICKLSECTSCVTGGKEIILLCDKVTKEDIQIRFYEEKDGRLEWEAFGDFLASDVHKQVAISFKTPRYKDLEVQHSIGCYIQLQRPSDKSTSEPRPFEYLPMDADPLIKKRRGNDKDPYLVRDDLIMWADVISRKPGVPVGESPPVTIPRSIKVASRTSRLSDKTVKTEPPDNFCSLSPSPERGGRQVKAPISPQHNGGGLVFQNPSPIVPATLPMQVSLHYIPTSSGGSLVNIPIQSPQTQPFYQIPNGMFLNPNHSPYSPENSTCSSAYSGMPMTIPSPITDSIMDMDDGAAAAVAVTLNLPLYHDLDLPKPVVDNSGTLPDLGIMNSSELGIADNISLSNLSASLSNSLNIVDNPPLNNLDRKSEQEKRNQQINTEDLFTSNMHSMNIAIGDLIKSEDGIPSASNSLKNLTMDLENFNRLTERS